MQNTKDRLYKRLISDTAIIAIGTLGSKVLMYLLVRFYTEVLTREEYSIASNLTETASLLIPIISLGIGEAVFRFAMDEQFGKSRALSNGFAIFACGFLGLLIVTPLIGFIDYIRSYEWIIAVYVISSITHTLFSQFLRSQRMFKLFALQGIINTLLTVGFNVLFLIPLKMGINGYVLAVAAADLVTSIFMMIAAKLPKYIDIKTVSKAAIKSMLIFSLPLIPTTVSWWITNVSDRYMVTHFKGDNANGIYAVAYKIPTLLTVFVGIFNNAWKYSAVDVKDSEKEKDFVSRVCTAFISVIFTASAFIIILAKPIAKIMFSSEFYDAWIYIPILTAAMLFSSFSSFCGTIFISRKKSIYSLISTAVPAFVNIALNFLLIPLFDGKWAAMGAAIATLVAYLTMYIMKAVFSKKLLDYKLYPVKVLLNTLVLSSLILTVSFEMPYWILISTALVIITVALNIKPLLKTLKMVLKK